MKYCLVPLLFILILAQSFSQWLWVLDYQLNKEYIARVLCENKEKKASACKGKCQMLKNLKADEEKQGQGPEQKGQNKVEAVDFIQFTSLVSLPGIELNNIIYQPYPVESVINHSYPILRPPALF